MGDTLQRRSIVLDYQRCQTRHVLALVNYDPAVPETVTETAIAKRLLDKANQVDISKEDMPICIPDDN